MAHLASRMTGMAYLSLYRKYRPSTFEEILGQEHVSNTLSNAIREGRVAHAYLFTGPRGTGKTSTARILAKALNCENGGPTPTPCGKCNSCVSIEEGSSMDVIEMDAASHSKVDETREILAGVPLATAGGRTKVYVIDEVHMLSTGSFNALLKTLEEPPPHVVFILATTEAHKVLATIVSRTQRFDFRRLPADVLEKHLANVAAQEKIEVDQEALELLARHAEGSARDALSALDQLASFGGRVSVADAEGLLGRRSEDMLVDLFDAIATSDVGRVFIAMQGFVSQGVDMRQLALDTLEHARSLLLLKAAPEADGLLNVTVEERPGLALQADSFSAAGLLRTIDLVGKAIIEMRNAPNHRLLLEVALIRSAAPETDPSANGLLGRIERLERRLGIEGPASPGSAGAVEPSPPASPLRSGERPTAGAVGHSPSRPKGDVSSSPAPKKKTKAESEASRRGPADAAGADAVAKASSAAEAKPERGLSEPASPAAAAAGSEAGEVGLNHIRDAWPVIQGEVNKMSRRVGALLNPSRPLSFDNGALTVEVQSEFHRDTMGQDKNRSMLVDGIHAALGVRCSVAFAARGAAAAAPEPEPEESIADVEASEAIDAKADDPVELIRKGLAAEVVEEVGGSDR
jgi:DNA polymerase-3 subunit gamma/tau